MRVPSQEVIFSFRSFFAVSGFPSAPPSSCPDLFRASMSCDIAVRAGRGRGGGGTWMPGTSPGMTTGEGEERRRMSASKIQTGQQWNDRRNVVGLPCRVIRISPVEYPSARPATGHLCAVNASLSLRSLKMPCAKIQIPVAPGVSAEYILHDNDSHKLSNLLPIAEPKHAERFRNRCGKTRGAHRRNRKRGLCAGPGGREKGNTEPSGHGRRTGNARESDPRPAGEGGGGAQAPRERTQARPQGARCPASWNRPCANSPA